MDLTYEELALRVFIRVNADYLTIGLLLPYSDGRQFESGKSIMLIPEGEMNVFETILARRSVRSYTDKEVDRSTIRTLLEAAVHAPTAIHEEPWAFVVVQDRKVLQQLSDRAKPLFAEEICRSSLDRTGHDLEMFTRPEFNIFYDSGTLIIICSKSTGHMAVADCWLAAENLMLTACALGLGTCVIGSALPALSIPEVKAEFCITDEFSAIAPIIVGYPFGETAPTSRKEPVVLSYITAAGVDRKQMVTRLSFTERPLDDRNARPINT